MDRNYLDLAPSRHSVFYLNLWKTASVCSFRIKPRDLTKQNHINRIFSVFSSALRLNFLYKNNLIIFSKQKTQLRNNLFCLSKSDGIIIIIIII